MKVGQPKLSGLCGMAPTGDKRKRKHMCRERTDHLEQFRVNRAREAMRNEGKVQSVQF